MGTQRGIHRAGGLPSDRLHGTAAQGNRCEESAAEAARLKSTAQPHAVYRSAPDGQSPPAEQVTRPIGRATASAARRRPSPAETVLTKPAPTPSAGRIEIHAISDLSYAMAHCKIPVVDHITIHGAAEELRGAILQSASSARTARTAAF